MEENKLVNVTWSYNFLSTVTNTKSCMFTGYYLVALVLRNPLIHTCFITGTGDLLTLIYAKGNLY